MPTADYFIATLRVLACGDAAVGQLQHAVQVVFRRYVQEAEAPLRCQEATRGLLDLRPIVSGISSVLLGGMEGRHARDGAVSRA